MKVRLGFVTNSSSSSFICEVCGDTSSGWDMCLSESYMSECENGHIVCNCHIDTEKHKEEIEKRFYKEAREILKERQGKDKELIAYLLRESKTIEDILKLPVDEIEQLFENEFNWEATDDPGYMHERDFISISERPTENFFKEMCPICMHDEVTDTQLIDYATEKLGINREELTRLAREALITEDNK